MRGRNLFNKHLIAARQRVGVGRRGEVTFLRYGGAVFTMLLVELFISVIAVRKARSAVSTLPSAVNCDWYWDDCVFKRC